MARGETDSQSARTGFNVPVLFSRASSFFVLRRPFLNSRTPLPKDHVSRASPRDCLLHRLDELLQAEGLGEEVEFLALRQVLAKGVLGVARDEDHLEVGVALAQLAEKRRA